MCYRYTLKTQLDQLVREFQLLGLLPHLMPRYNIAPTQPVPAVLVGEDGRTTLRLLRWGLTPHWAKTVSSGAQLANARLETAREKPAFRDPFKYRRCVLPADGFYEWVASAPGPRGGKRAPQPHYIHRTGGRLMALAGLWDHWQDAHGNELETCTILTTAAAGVVAPLHERMPVMLEPGYAERWLRAPSAEAAQQCLERSPLLADLREQPVSTRVNRVTEDDPRCIEPVSAPPPGLFDA